MSSHIIGLSRKDSEFVSNWRRLTKGQKEVMLDRCLGKSRFEISLSRNVTERTVQGYIEDAFRKLSVRHLGQHNRTAYVCFMAGRLHQDG